MDKKDIIVIGGSSGGLEVLKQLLSRPAIDLDQQRTLMVPGLASSYYGRLTMATGLLNNDTLAKESIEGNEKKTDRHEPRIRSAN